MPCFPSETILLLKIHLMNLVYWRSKSYPLASYLAHEENQGILLFTHDATIAQSPYIDRLEPAG